MLTDILRDSCAASNERACFLLHVLPEKLAEYIEVHQRVWPEMLQALSNTGWKHYSLFVEEQTGLVVGYFEAEDVQQAMKSMAATDVDARWQAEMAQYFTVPTSGTPQILSQYFYLP